MISSFRTALLSLFFALPFLLQCQSNNYSAKVDSRTVNIYSDGTRLSGNIFYPKTMKEGEKLPAILLCHGWGGLKSHLNATYAPAFASEGFVVLAFDYRGWGESDSRLVIEGEMPEPDEKGMVMVKARAIRELVDPEDQFEDIQSALDFLEGDPTVDVKRIGIWGTSFGGGLVIKTAAQDPRVKVVVSQVGSMHSNWVEQYFPDVHQREVQRARGEMDPVPQGTDKIGELKGTPYLERMAVFKPIELSEKIKVPTLLIDAENEELFDRMEHSALLYDKIKDKVPSKYIVVPQIKHYGIYQEKYPESVAYAVEWYKKHL